MINSLFRRSIKFLNSIVSSSLFPGVPTFFSYFTMEIHLNRYKDSPCVFNFSFLPFVHSFVYRSSSWRFYMMVHQRNNSFSKCSFLRTRYVQLLSGFVGTSGWLCWSCFTIVEMSCNWDAESGRTVLGEGISFVDRESLWWTKLGHPCRVLNFRKPCPRLWADGNLLMSGCRELDT